MEKSAISDFTVTMPGSDTVLSLVCPTTNWHERLASLNSAGASKDTVNDPSNFEPTPPVFEIKQLFPTVNIPTESDPKMVEHKSDQKEKDTSNIK